MAMSEGRPPSPQSRPNLTGRFMTEKHQPYGKIRDTLFCRLTLSRAARHLRRLHLSRALALRRRERGVLPARARIWSAPTGDFVETIQSDSTCPVLFAKTFPFPSDPNQNYIYRRPASFSRGVSRSSRTLSAGCDGRGGTQTNGAGHGRRSRVVLASRRWR